MNRMIFVERERQKREEKKHQEKEIKNKNQQVSCRT
jgi:hypothetical protein